MKFMSSQILKNMAKAALPILAVAFSVPAFAVPVAYSTVGTFDCSGAGSGCTSVGNNVATLGTVGIITYGNFAGTVNVPKVGGTTASFGTFTTTGLLDGSQTVSAHFNLAITQTVPLPSGSGTADLTDLFSGTLTVDSTEGDSNTIVLTFTGGNGTTPPPSLGTDPFSLVPAYTFKIAGVQYWVDQRTALVPPTTNGGVSTIQGAINASAVPEPTFYALTGLGFASLVGIAFRRRGQSQS